MTFFRRGLVHAAIAASASIAASAEAGITWLTQDITLYASWAGDVPIDGFTFLSGSSNTVDNPGGVHILGLTGRMTVGTSSSLLDSPLSMGLDLNNTYNYNGFWSDGTPDLSTRTFTIAGTHSYVFHLDQTMTFGLVSLVQTLAPFSICRIEQGSMVNGEFESSGTLVDLTSLPANFDIGAGYYRFRADFENVWDANTGFLNATAVSWRVVPAPGVAVGLMLGLPFLRSSRRRR